MERNSSSPAGVHIIPPVFNSHAHGGRLAVAHDARRRLDRAARWLRNTAVDDARSTAELLVVAPSRGAADDLLRRTGLPLLGVHRLTLGRLAAELATPALAAEGRAPVRGMALEALATRALAETRAEAPLDYFEPVADTPGMAGALTRAMIELRSYGVAADALKSLGPRGADLARLLRRFEDRLESHRLLDPAGLMSLAARQASSSDHPLLNLPVVWLDVLPETPLEAALLSAVTGRSPSYLATAPAGDRQPVQRLATSLGAHPIRIDEGEPSDVGEPAELRRLRRAIFSDLGEAHDDPSDVERSVAEEASREAEASQGLQFFAAPGEGRECVEIARRLHALGRQGVAFDACAVALRDPDSYIPLIEEAFHRARIPVHFTRGTRRPDPAGRAFLALLACADEQLAAGRFAEYLSLGQVPDADAEGAPPNADLDPWAVPDGEQMVFKFLPPTPEELAETSSYEDTLSSKSGGSSSSYSPDASVSAGSLRAPRRWEHWLVDAAVVRGRDRWRRRLNGMVEELKLRLRGPGASENQLRRLHQELVELESLRRFALPLIDDLDQLPSGASWGDWLRHLERLAGRALIDPERILEVLSELRPMAAVGPVGLPEVRRVLAERLSLLRTEPSRRRFGRVFVCTLDELRGRCFEFVFVPGLAEGIFPRRAHEDPLLLDDDRRRLAERGQSADGESPEPQDRSPSYALPTQEERFARERRLLRLAIGAAEHGLITSYPSLDALRGRSRVPSFYALDLLRAAEGRLPALHQLERRATAASSLRLGWPAPRDPTTAIDEAELDLALLTRWMELPEDQARSRGRYLLDTNPRLQRSLRNRYARWGRKWSRADGLNSRDPVTAAILGSRLTSERAYSATALQHFARCPYRFYLQGVLRLRPQERFERLERMDPLTRGSLYHQVQFELLSLLKERRLLPMQGRHGDDAYIDTLHRLTDQTLDAVAKRYEENLAPAIPRVWHSEVESLKLDLRGWIRSLLQSTRTEPWVPTKFELAFGLPEDDQHDPDSSDQEVIIAGGRRLRGSIDLVEHDPRHGTLRITDHKTGRMPKVSGRRLYVGGGELLQPLLYSLAAEALLDRPVESGRLYYGTRRGGFRVLEAPLDDEARDVVDVFFQQLDGHLGDSFLPAAPADGACRHCDFRRLCGPNEPARTARKDPKGLEALRRVRQLP